MVVGWGLTAGIVLTTVALCYPDYGSTYQCWLDMEKTGLVVAQLTPMIILVILIFTMIEAAGNADYKTLEVNNSKPSFEA